MSLRVLEVKICHFLHFCGGHIEIQDGRQFLITWVNPMISLLCPSKGIETNIIHMGMLESAFYAFIRSLAAILDFGPSKILPALLRGAWELNFLFTPQ